MRPAGSRWPSGALRWVPGAGPVTLRPLAAGLVNRSYRVERDGRVYSMRLAADGADLGVDRDWECRVLECAGRAGLAPVIACCEPSRGILVADWTAFLQTCDRFQFAPSTDHPDTPVTTEAIRLINALEADPCVSR